MSEQTPTVQTTLKIDPTLEINVGSLIDERFGVSQELAVGQTAMTFVVQDQKKKMKEFAAKIHINEDPTTQARFGQETELLSGIDHPNILSFVSSGIHTSENGANPYMITEFLKDGSLAKKRNNTSTEQTLGYLADAAAGISHLHDSGIIHRDIKPANIFVGDGMAKIGDLGISIDEKHRHTDPLYEMLENDSEITIGSPCFIAPEIYDKHLTSRSSDVFSLGVTAYLLFSGQTPWQKGVVPYEEGQGPFESIRLRKNTPANLRKIIYAALDKNPADRPTIEDFMVVADTADLRHAA